MKNKFRLLTLAILLQATSSIAMPITSTVTVDGTEWAQVSDFTNLSWDDINTVCPFGTCINSGSLNGFDMTDWVWASLSDVAELFNFYVGADVLGLASPDLYVPGGYEHPWTTNFLDDFSATVAIPDVSRGVQGWFADPIPAPSSGWLNYALLQDGERSANPDGASTSQLRLPNIRTDGNGAWFQRPASTPTPTPATLALIGLGLVGLGFSRRKRQTPNPRVPSYTG